MHMSNPRQHPDYRAGRAAANAWANTVDWSLPFTQVKNFRLGLDDFGWIFFLTATAAEYNGLTPTERIMRLMGGVQKDGTMFDEPFYHTLWATLQQAVDEGKAPAFGLGFVDEILAHANRIWPMPSAN